MINIYNSSEFELLLSALSRDIVNANIYYKLLKDINSELESKPLVAIQSRAFWSLTQESLLISTTTLLCRAYDQNNKSLSLHNLLLTITENMLLFDEANFRERKKGNPFVDSLAQSPRKPDVELLKDDIALCSKKDELVKNLTVHRGSTLAHLNAKNIVKKNNINDKNPLPFADLGILLARAKEILNRYSSLFSASTYSTQIIGHDDFKYIFECVENTVLELQKKREE